MAYELNSGTFLKKRQVHSLLYTCLHVGWYCLRRKPVEEKKMHLEMKR
jgi:hypothetical protein